LARRIADKKDPIDIANTHLGIPYRDDGALDDKGHFTRLHIPKRSWILQVSTAAGSLCQFADTYLTKIGLSLRSCAILKETAGRIPRWGKIGISAGI